MTTGVFLTDDDHFCVTEAWPSSPPLPKSVPARKGLDMSQAPRFSSLQHTPFLLRPDAMRALTAPVPGSFGVEVPAA